MPLHNVSASSSTQTSLDQEQDNVPISNLPSVMVGVTNTSLQITSHNRFLAEIRAMSCEARSIAINTSTKTKLKSILKMQPQSVKASGEALASSSSTSTALEVELSDVLALQQSVDSVVAQRMLPDSQETILQKLVDNIQKLINKRREWFIYRNQHSKLEATSKSNSQKKEHNNKVSKANGELKIISQKLNEETQKIFTLNLGSKEAKYLARNVLYQLKWTVKGVLDHHCSESERMFYTREKNNIDLMWKQVYSMQVKAANKEWDHIPMPADDRSSKVRIITD